jgi:uncharacterized protein YacL
MANVARALFVVFCGAIGYFISYRLGYDRFLGAVLAVVCAAAMAAIEFTLTRRPVRQVVAGLVGLAAGLVVANLLSYVASIVIRMDRDARALLFMLASLTMGYLGVMVAVRKGGDLVSGHQPLAGGKSVTAGTTKILDTSVIIDGRIADIAKAHFVEGALVIPRFVLEELQHIADSADNLKRARGRRGLDILKKLQSQRHLSVRIDDVPMEESDKVDSKLVRMAQQRGASIITNDYNLNKVADLHGVIVLNINDLAKALKPVFLPGEEIEVKLIKRGKEAGQGVGYLEDGTMVVVDDGSTKLGGNVVSVVTSVLQTTAGRMIFAKLKG